MAASAATMVEQHAEQLTSSEAFFKHFQQEAVCKLFREPPYQNTVLT
jgi:hypothetical protein